ncbi:MAG: hypothetical protein COA79_17390 [Planctomycetota bacterium]|nr:MAG: hypothetical protein COA79_17390 [Planctomycetota bacterium]
MRNRSASVRNGLTLIFMFVFTFCMSQSKIDSLPKANVPSSILLNGNGDSDIWVRANKLSKMNKNFTEKKNPDNDVSIEIVQVGQWFVVGVDIVEPDSIISREGLNGEALWYDDNISFNFYGIKNLTAQINPLGAVSVRENGKKKQQLIRDQKIFSSVKISSKKWRVEIAFHESIVKSKDSKVIKLKIGRERQHRGFEPFRSYSKVYTIETNMSFDKSYEIIVNQSITTKNPYLAKAQLVEKIPASHADWLKLPAIKLIPSFGNIASDEFQLTEVRVAFTKKEFGIYVINFDNDMKNISKKEISHWSGDVNEIFLGPVGYGYVQFATNPHSKLITNRGNSGGKRVKKLPPFKSVICNTEIKKSYWSTSLVGNLSELLSKCNVPSGNTPDLKPWWFQVIRFRTARKAIDHIYQESIVTTTGSGTAHVPLRFAQLVIEKMKTKGLQKNSIKPNLLKAVIQGDAKLKIKPNSSLMDWINLQKNIHRENAIKDLDAIKTKNDWIRFSTVKKDQLIRSVFPNLKGGLPKAKKIDFSIAYEFNVADIKVSGIIFNNRNGVPVMGTIYEPLNADKLKPVMIMIPAHHTTRNAYDLSTLGKNLADQGCIAIAIDLFGSGERGVAARWNHKNHQKNLLGGQMKLIGEEILGWSVSDILSTVDYLYTRKDVDKTKIGIIGGVAGGGDLSAMGAALDSRITLSAPFNFHQKRIISGWHDYARSYPLALKNEMTSILINVLRAPNHFVQANEFAWRDRSKAAHAYAKKVYGLYQKESNHTFLHGDRNTHATHFNWMHRVPFYKILNKWWDLNLPETKNDEVLLRLKKYHLESTMHDNGVDYIKKHFTLSKSDLNKLNKIKETIGDQSHEKFNEPYMIFLDQANQFRKKNHRLNLKNKYYLILSLDKILGGTKPDVFIPEKFKNQQWNDYQVENLWLKVNKLEAGKAQLGIPMWIIKPNTNSKKIGAIVCIAQEGKKRFLFERSEEILTCLKSGIAIVLIDVIGTGETEVDSLRLPDSAANNASVYLAQMGKTLIGERVKNVRSVLAYLKVRTDIDPNNISLWGEGFSDPNGKSGAKFKFEETGFRQTGPHKMNYVEAMGMIVSLFSAILSDEVKIKSILARGGLISYESVLMNRYYYIPHDLIIPNILTKLDLRDVMESLRNNGCEIILEDVRDGKNRVLSNEIMKEHYSNCYSGAYSSFHQSKTIKRLTH